MVHCDVISLESVFYVVRSTYRYSWQSLNDWPICPSMNHRCYSIIVLLSDAYVVILVTWKDLSTSSSPYGFRCLATLPVDLRIGGRDLPPFSLSGGLLKQASHIRTERYTCVKLSCYCWTWSPSILGFSRVIGDCLACATWSHTWSWTWTSYWPST